MRPIHALLVVFALLGGRPALAQEKGWTLAFTVPKAAYVLGEPIEGRLQARNDSQHDLAWSGFQGMFFLDGNARPCRYGIPFAQAASAKVARPRGTPQVPPPHFEPPGTRHATNPSDIIRLCFDDRNQRALGAHELCFHKPESTENQVCVSFTVIPPTGVDLEAYDYFKGQPLAMLNLGELLEKFPASTYVAYTVREYSFAAGLARSDAQHTLDMITLGRQLGVPCVSGHCEKSNGLESIYGEVIPVWREKWLGIVLDSHPDIWFADELKYIRACNQFARNNNPEGATQLAALAKQARPDIAEKAGQLLALVKQKGMVK